MYMDNGEGGEPRGGPRRLGLALLGILGAFLLLPGLCGAVFTVAALANPKDPYMGAVYVISIPSLLVGVLGFWLLRRVIRKARSGES